MSAPSAQPDLYQVDESGEPTLIGLKDSSGSVSFPFQIYGSEHNGDVGEKISPVPLAGTGTVSAVVDVHIPVDPALGFPYRLASVVLDEGPMIRSVLVDAPDVTIGSRVRAVTVPVTRDDVEVAELRFTPEEVVT
ncbi:Zn-ribbon domain-containing OB-fold protein [Nocardioides donggukensis]|uniref:OB-fold domain-containing protein n=1 Tax=Nocardioides donggukensis TaxID=2774019 RepID=A0A927Q2W5_9ACTN|nr:OB-fold domain-containing protein [Nocardioides donggukensis]MBD8870779.1 OB-fold domain-containing protein [Nocardioides donggukensis]